MKTLLMVGTRKGLWLGSSDQGRQDWSWTGPHFGMEEVYSVLLDQRRATPRLLVGTKSSWLGPQVWRSDDLGESWQETPNGAIRFPEHTGATLTTAWQLQPGSAAGEDLVVWAGTEPGAIFKSVDGGETFELMRGLWDHPHRTEWNAGYGGQAFHTILPHPRDPQRVLAAISSGGVYATEDGGDTWHPSNHGIKAEFFPGERNYPEFGQCVHKIGRDAEDPERLYLQNHGGVYRSDDGGATWIDIAPGLSSEFGLTLVAHPHRGDTAYVFPLDSSGARWPVDGKARVFRTTDAGTSWETLGEGGLPDHLYVAVMRDAMCADTHDRVGLYVGTRNGAVYSSADEGGTWAEAIRDLPDVLVVRAAALPEEG